MDAAAILLDMGSMPPRIDLPPSARAAASQKQKPMVQPRSKPAPKLKPPQADGGPSGGKLLSSPRRDPTREEKAQAVALVRLGSNTDPAVPVYPAPQPADPSVAASRFELDKLGQSAGSKLPCPVLTWVAAIIHTIADDDEISGGDSSLTGLTKTAVYLEGGSGNEVGLQLRFKSLKGPQGDLICRIARKVMEIMGKKDRLRGDMFSDWEALRKHLCEDKGLDLGPGPGKKLPHFSFLWTGLKRGGNQSRDFSQTYFERRYTPGLAELSPEERKVDRKLGGGGNPGLMAHCAMLLQRDFPGLYDNAKKQALADIANGLQCKDFQNLAVRARNDLALARQRHPPLAKKQLTKKVAEERNANKHALEAETLHPDLAKWIPKHREEIARSWLAAAEFSNAQIQRVEVLAKQHGQPRFDIEAIRSLVRSLGLNVGDNIAATYGTRNAIEWSSELVGLKNQVTTAEEAQAEQAVGQALARTSSAPSVIGNSTANGITSNSVAFHQDMRHHPGTVAAAMQQTGNVAAFSGLQLDAARGPSEAAALVSSSSAPTAAHSTGGPSCDSPCTAQPAAGLKRKLDSRCESAPDDGLDPEDPAQSLSNTKGRAPKVSKMSNADMYTNQTGLLHVIGHAHIRENFFGPDNLGLVDLWRLRAVCRALRSWSKAQLCLLPRVVALAGVSPADFGSSYEPSTGTASTKSSFQSLDLATLSWQERGVSLPAASSHTAPQMLPSTSKGDATSIDWAQCSAASSLRCSTGNPTQIQGQRIVVVQSTKADTGSQSQNRGSICAFEWSSDSLKDSGSWRALPELPTTLIKALQAQGAGEVAPPLPTVCCLRDGRTLLTNTGGSYQALILADDRCSWVPLHSLQQHAGSLVWCRTAAAVELADGKVFIARGRSYEPAAVGSGQSSERTATSVSGIATADLWDPLNNHWTSLPPLSSTYSAIAACMLPSGNVAVIGCDCSDDDGLRGEVYDRVAQTWSPLPAMPFSRVPGKTSGSTEGNCVPAAPVTPSPVALSVPGGFIVVGTASRMPSEPSVVAHGQQQTQQWAQFFDEASSEWFILPNPLPASSRPGGQLVMLSPPAIEKSVSVTAAATGQLERVGAVTEGTSRSMTTKMRAMTVVGSHPLVADDCTAGGNVYGLISTAQNLFGAQPTKAGVAGVNGTAMLGHMADSGSDYESLRDAGYGVI